MVTFRYIFFFISSEAFAESVSFRCRKVLSFASRGREVFPVGKDVTVCGLVGCGVSRLGERGRVIFEEKVVK
jgi:hypothetical protein